MYLGILKLYFDREGWHSTELSKTCSSVCERVGQRFKLQARSDERAADNDQLVLVIVGLAKSQTAILNKLDDASQFCETTDLGRIVLEEVFVEDVDLLLEEQSEEDS